MIQHIRSIKAGGWFMIQRDGDLFGKYCPPHIESYECNTFNFGEMYIFNLETDPGQLFYWNPIIDDPISPVFPEKPIHFSFVEKDNYIPVIIESIENGDNILEIGGKKGNSFVGAEVVKDYPINFRAYTEDISDMTFEVVTDDGLEKQISNRKLCPKELSFENGIVYMDLTDIGNLSVKQPNTFSLVSIYPNPFNPVIDLQFNLNKTVDVELSIFDIQGKIITTIINGTLEKGYHSLTWYAGDMSSGVYICQLQSGNEIINKKIMLLK